MPNTKHLFNREVTLHSQPATRQDEWVLEVTRGLVSGYFVEVGAYDGVRYSNTLALEESFDWSGILVEPLPHLASRCRDNRPKCKVREAAVGAELGVYPFVDGDQWSGIWRYLPETLKAEHHRRGNVVTTVPGTTLWRLLDDEDAPEIVDYLSLDTEGSEIAILKHFFSIPPWRSFRCMTVEILDPTTLPVLEMLLAPHGMVLDQVRAWDACFRHTELT
jgi:FkbM family methyltransferase